MKNILDFLKEIPTILEERKVIMLIIDGLGTTNLFLPGFKKRIYKTVFPSSTPTFFYSFHSLLPPSKHGFLEWYMRFKDMIVTIPPWKTIDGKELKLGKEISKKDVFPFKSLSQILKRKGFSSTYYTPFADSAFTKATSKGAKIKKVDFISEVFPLEDSDFIFIYWPSIDAILHERYEDEAFKVETKMIETFVKILKKKMQKNSVLFILSDHGLIKCKRRYLLPKINSCFPVGGEELHFIKMLKKSKLKLKLKKEK